jgi:electron transfer flavoprotein alpha subunit
MSVLVLIESVASAATPESLALLPLAKSLSAGDVIAVAAVPEAEADALAEAATAAGADAVAIAPLADGEDSLLVTPLVEALAAAAEEVGPSVVLAPASADGREAAARLGVRLGTSPLWDADRLAGGKPFVAGKEVLWAQWVIEATSARPTSVVVVNPSVTADPVGPGEGRRIEITPPIAVGATIHETTVSEPEDGRPALPGAAVVVAGGLGLGSADDWVLVEELADALGAAVGATRSAVDEGWVPFPAQIGMTGEVIAPRVYIGMGISGAIQHTSGMQRSGLKIAVNEDEDATIFEVADLGVIADVHEFVPALVEALRARGA